MTEIRNKIDYRKCYINHLTRIIEDKLKEIREIVCMPDNLIEEKIGYLKILRIRRKNKWKLK